MVVLTPPNAGGRHSGLARVPPTSEGALGWWGSAVLSQFASEEQVKSPRTVDFVDLRFFKSPLFIRFFSVCFRFFKRSVSLGEAAWAQTA